ncbi:MAG: xanthine dehydrogenase small subunit [Planctomycetes bacterium]|nr:xanthine dehydrogenase small subunit [Planctomycetota bacterium]
MRDHLVFYVNGTRHTVRGSQAAVTLSDYLRNGITPRLPGTKVACAEGDCGACTVLVGKPSADGNGFEYQTIDACIAFVYQLDCCHLLTVEGLQHDTELSDVQAAMVDCHGSQCGYCTPGFVMALHGLVEQRTCDNKLTDDELRLGLSGNLCRCTGYAQILDAGHELNPSTRVGAASHFDTKAMLADFAAIDAGPVLVNAGSTPEVFLPATLEELLARRAARPSATLVAGATDLGVQHNHGKISPSDILVTMGVKELDQLEVTDNELIIGAAVSWSRIEAYVRDRVPEYYQILTRFGSPQVRHAGTLIGNLANASPIADSIPFHYVAGSTLTLASVGGRREVAIEQFYLGYKQLDLRPDEVIVSVRTPLPTANEHLKLYKISKRRDMDISTVTAAFWLEIEEGIIRSARIASGGVGPMVVRLPRAEVLLSGEPLTLEVMRAAGCVAREEISPISDVRGSANYRRQLVENLFVKCFYDLSSNLQPVEV